MAGSINVVPTSTNLLGLGYGGEEDRFCGYGGSEERGEEGFLLETSPL